MKKKSRGQGNLKALMEDIIMKKSQSRGVISDVELRIIGIERENIKALKETLRDAEMKLEESEADVIKRLWAGAKVTGDNLTAKVIVETGAARPKWKEEYIAHFVNEHGKTASFIEAGFKVKYPGKDRDVLIISIK